MKRQIFISKDNQPQGPFSDDELGQKLISGEIEVHTLACEEGAPAWKSVGDVLDPQFVSKVIEFRRVSQAMASQLQSSLGASATPPAAGQPPVVSLLEADGRPIQVPNPSAMPSMVMTSLPTPAHGSMASGMPPPALPGSGMPQYSMSAVPAASGSVRLSEEAIGAAPSEESGGRPRWQLAAGAVAVLAAIGFFAYEPITTRWHAKQEYTKAEAAMAGGQYADAMQAARAASRLMPDSGIYLNTWQEARRKALESLKAGLGKEPPLDYLVHSRDFLTKYEGALGDEGVTAVRDWNTENEPAALQQIRAAFDGDLAGLTALLSAREGDLSTYFNGADNRTEAKRLHDQWVALRDARTAWDANQQIKAVELLAKVPDDLRKGAAFTALEAETQQLRDSVLEKLRSATDLASGRHFIEAMPVLDEIEPHAGWIKEIKQEKSRIQLTGENYYAAQLVGAVRAKNAAGTRENLQNYMQFRRRPLTDAQLTEFLEIRDFPTYLAKLSDYGLRPRGKAARQNYADVVLIASNLPNFTNTEEAREFLANAYYEWAKAELDRGRSSPACYLSLLAAKYGHAAANELFDTSHDKILSEFTLAIRAVPLVVNAAKASRTFSSQIEVDALNAIRNNLPGFMKWQSPENTQAGEADPLLLVKLTPVLAEFSRKNDRVARTASDRYKFPDIVEDNPAYFSAQDAVNQAENALSTAQSNYAAAKSANDQMQQQASSGGSSGLALFGAILGGVTQGISDGEVNNARAQLAQARSTLSRTPPRVSRPDVRELSWTEYDVLTDFSTTVKLEFKVGDKTILAKSLSATTQHKSLERPASNNGVVPAIQKQEPNLEEMETALLEKLRPQIQALATPAFLAQLKSSLTTYISQQAGAVDAEAQANALIGMELLWWKHPLYNAATLRSPDLLGRFGDVIN